MYEINYDDQRFQDVEDEKQVAIDESNQMYDGMIGNSDKYYQDQIDATRDWTDKQKELQQEQTDLTLKQIEQQKEQAEKDYTKEQKASYVDWQKESNKYGANAEQMAGQGLQNSGYAESSQVSMYNTYQNRVATARESWQTAKQNYDNAMTEAKLQNSATLAEIAYQGLQQELQLSLQSFQYKNELLMAQASAKTQILDRYDTRYQAVLDQMNTENALQEKMRQFDQQMALITPDDEGDEPPSTTGTEGAVTATKIRLNSALDDTQLSLMNERLKAEGLPLLSGNERIYVHEGKYYIRVGQEEYIEIPAKSVLPNPSVLGEGELPEEPPGFFEALWRGLTKDEYYYNGKWRKGILLRKPYNGLGL